METNCSEKNGESVALDFFWGIFRATRKTSPELYHFFYLLPSGEHTKSNGKWPFIVDFPIKNGGSFHCYVSSPEGIFVHLVLEDSSPPLANKDMLHHVIILSCDYTQGSLSCSFRASLCAARVRD